MTIVIFLVPTFPPLTLTDTQDDIREKMKGNSVGNSLRLHNPHKISILNECV